jgi:hypothetical protein
LNLFSGCTFRSIVSIGGRRGLLDEDCNEHVLLRHTTRPACLLINRLYIEASTDNPVRSHWLSPYRRHKRFTGAPVDEVVFGKPTLNAVTT